MSKYFINEGVDDEQKKFLYDVLNLSIEFLDGTIRENKVLQYKTTNIIKSHFTSGIPMETTSLEELYKELSFIAENSIAQSDHKFLAFPDSAGSVATYAADIFTSFLNQNLIAIDRSAPVATFIETQLIAWLRALIGYSNSEPNEVETLSQLGGMWTSGGSMSNHIAVLAALINKFPNVLETGLYGLKKRPVMLLAKGIAHYSFLNAAKSLGLGEDGIVWLGTDGDYTTDIDSLTMALEELSDDVEPFLVVAVAGNCRTSDIDSIANIADICTKKKIWLHVDACHGGSLLFSDTLRKRLLGIQQADSVTIDPHKGLFVTYSSSYILFKETSVMNKFCRYPEKVCDPSNFDIGLITPFYGSRGFDSLKLWLMIKHLGKEEIGRYVEQRDKIYHELCKRLEETTFFVFFNNPQFYRSAFVFFPKIVKAKCEELMLDKSDIIKIIEKYTIIYSDTLYQRGEVVFDLFKLNDFGNKLGFGTQLQYHVIGMSVGHVEMVNHEYDEIIKEVLLVGNELVCSMLAEVADNNITALSGVTLPDSPAAW